MLSVAILPIVLRLYTEYHNTERLYADVVMLNIIMSNASMMSVIILKVLAPYEEVYVSLTEGCVWQSKGC